MLIVPIDNVTEGMVLAKDVASTSARDYKTLLMKGTLITADMINLLKSKGIKNVTIKGERTLDQEIDKPPEEESLEEATDVIKNQHIGKALDELSTIFEHNGEIQQLSQKAIEQVDDIADDILVDIGNDSTYLGNQMIALQNYDDYTYKHCLRVAMLSTGIANELHLSQGDIKELPDTQADRGLQCERAFGSAVSSGEIRRQRLSDWSCGEEDTAYRAYSDRCGRVRRADLEPPLPPSVVGCGDRGVHAWRVRRSF